MPPSSWRAWLPSARPAPAPPPGDGEDRNLCENRTKKCGAVVRCTGDTQVSGYFWAHHGLHHIAWAWCGGEPMWCSKVLEHVKRGGPGHSVVSRASPCAAVGGGLTRPG